MARSTTKQAVQNGNVAQEVTQAATTAETADNGNGTKYNVKQRRLTPHTIVTVRNGFAGVLVYRSRHTGEKFKWDGYGSEQYMELQELRNAKGSSKAFFENGWFLIDDDDVIEYLGLQSVYKNALKYDDIDALFGLKPNEIESKIKAAPDGQKVSIAHRARQLISDGKIDSIRVITTLEKCLGVELIER